MHFYGEKRKYGAVTINIFILSVLDDLEVWKKTTLSYANNLATLENVNVTLLLVSGQTCDTKVDESIGKSLEVRHVRFETKAKGEFTCLDMFFDPKNHTILLNHLEEILTEKTFDFIQLESIIFAQFLPNLRSLSQAKIVYRQYYWESAQMTEFSKSGKFSVFKYFSSSRLINKIKELEQKMPDFDLVITSDPDSLEQYADLNMFVIPESLEGKVRPQELHSSFKLFFVGNLKVVNIQHSILWFLNETWGKLQEKVKDIEFHIVGKSEPWFVDLLSNFENVFYYDQVVDFNKFLQDKSILLLPYDKPLGIWDEYLLAMLRGKIIVAYSEAVCCWGLTPMIHYMPAKDSVKFIEVLEHIYQKPEIRQYFSQQIINFAEQEIDEKYWVKVILRLYYKVLTQNI